ncbi:hypothetical protein Ga0466249_002393 [Sporomusaceae bacterium BoRhaA]|uniref:hypothetical protein n=1 Tax=Pelorhabdus rhamnosifermentans TaxID=2772457 RepID=UPI001C062140|nr:hypothetical protein [Pelorhabdus rhamnosifermentans]MBU2701279.1 hypothetical protein [Pelorhabdus rhamnosifermentans]
MTTTTFPYTGALQTFTVPAAVYSITVTALGASGGSSAFLGGHGSSMTGDFVVTPGENLAILVGGAGVNDFTDYGGGGGGGSFVWRGTAYSEVSTGLLLAGGGGGGSGESSGAAGLDASTGNNGVAGIYGGSGGTNGSGGKAGRAAGGGAGITGNGESYGGTGGSAISNGGAGGTGGHNNNDGGFGGGGGGGGIEVSSSPSFGGGGGGGYSGGGSSNFGAGGGGSFNSGSNQINSISSSYGNGAVTITYTAQPRTRGILLFG